MRKLQQYMTALAIPIAAAAMLAGCSSSADTADGSSRQADEDSATSVIESPTMGNVDSILMGGYPDNIEVCMGKSSLTPILVENPLQEELTFTWSLDQWAAKEVAFYTQPEQIACGGQESESQSGSFTVPGNGTYVFYAAAGGGTQAKSKSTVEFGLNNVGNDFSFQVNINKWKNSFESFTLDPPYLNSSDPGFVGVTSMGTGMLNVQQCNNNNGTPSVDVNGWSASFYATSGESFSWGMNQPICFYVSS